MKWHILYTLLSLISPVLVAKIEVDGKSLRKNWALELIGADLVKEEMRMMPNIAKVPFSIFDIGFEPDHLRYERPLDIPLAFNGNRRIIGHHGTSVAHLINGHGPYGVSDVVDYVSFKRVDPSIFYFSAVRSIWTTHPRPWIISNSVGWTTSDILGLAHDIDQAGIIWVLASGNRHPLPMAEHEAQAPVTLVGSVSPYGLESSSSQTASTLKLLAPSDDYLVTINGRGEETLFGGTSGATPIVSATMANLMSIRPSLTRNQLETLLYESGFKMPHSILDRHHSRLINAYAAFHWLQNLNQRCGEDNSCFDNLLNTPVEFHFYFDLETATRFCDGEDTPFNEEHLSILRKAFLLKRDIQTGELLRCVYQRLLLDLNATLIENLILVESNPSLLLTNIQELNKLALKQGWWKNPALREKEYFSKESIQILYDILETNEGIGSYRARQILHRLGEIDEP